MRLSEFITANVESILEEFAEFARTHTTAGETMDIESLRDHAAEILRVIAEDMEQPQTSTEQRRKAEGKSDVDENGSPTAAQQHGADRAGSGFTFGEMFSEYRALRASVLRLWSEAGGQHEERDLDDVIRFNEAIDQAMAESITKYSIGIERSREKFLAILGHDLRSPLNAVLAASEFLVNHANLAERNLALAATIHSSGERMLSLVDDLLDFTRSHLGQGIPIYRSEVDIGKVAVAGLREVRARHPDRDFRIEATGDLRGEWDGRRVSQALANLVDNAVQHGDEESPVEVTVRGEADEVVIGVHNRGPAIAASDLGHIFEPFRSIVSTGGGERSEGRMGMGLYIARQIAVAHGGEVRVDSSDEAGTTFELHLPRAG